MDELVIEHNGTKYISRVVRNGKKTRIENYIEENGVRKLESVIELYAGQ